MSGKARKKSLQAIREAKRVAAGLCRSHRDRLAAPGAQYCEECLKKRRIAARERYRKGINARTRPYRCSLCHQTGHTKRTCTASKPIQARQSPGTDAETENQNPDTK